MADNTKIEWADATVNAISGCSVVSPGCTNCYAMRLAGTRLKHHPSRAGLTSDSKAGPVWNGTVRLEEKQLHQPLRWQRRRRIFWNAHGDLFHEAVPDEWIDRVFAVCVLSPQHEHMILTKRAARMKAYLAEEGVDARIKQTARLTANHFWRNSRRTRFATNMHCWPLPNVWLGVSVEDQARADERIPDLLATPAAIRFISAEPLLGPVDLSRLKEAGAQECWSMPDHQSSLNALTGHYWGEDYVDGTWKPWMGDEQPSPGFGEPGYHPPLNWVIAGGESGPDTRPMHPDWARSLRDQCAAAGVAFHFKQWGEWAPIDEGTPDGVPITFILPDGFRCIHANAATTTMVRVGKKRAGRLLDGRTHEEWPA